VKLATSVRMPLAERHEKTRKKRLIANVFIYDLKK